MFIWDLQFQSDRIKALVKLFNLKSTLEAWKFLKIARTSGQKAGMIGLKARTSWQITRTFYLKARTLWKIARTFYLKARALWQIAQIHGQNPADSHVYRKFLMI